MLKIDHICKTFNAGTINEKVALNGVDLTLEDGDFVTVIGGNGAGKSTTLNAVAGVWPVDSGKIFIGGDDVTKLSEYKRAKYLGRVFQDPMTGSNLLFADQTDAATQMSKASILTDIEQLKYQPLKEGKDQIGYNRLNEVLRIEPGQSFGLTWELQKEATSFNFSLPKSENSGRVFEWSADGRQWTTIADIPTDQARFKLEKLAPEARYIRMRNATDKQMQIYLYEFAVTTKEDTSIDPVRLMYDKNLESVNTLTAGSRITIDKEKDGSLELYLSGSPCSQVVVEGAPLKGKVKQVLYSGPANYIKLKKEALESVKALELYNAGSSPVNIHEIN